MEATGSVATEGGMGAGIWGALTTEAADTTPTATGATTTAEATTTATCRLITTLQHITAGPTIHGRRQSFTHGAGERRPGTDITVTTSIRIRRTRPRRCG